jgi:cytochrome oxidase Cu insertion factor (SCO1/SenC/PrrC family)
MNDDMSDPLSNSVRNRKRLTLIALMALFLSPVLAAWLWTPDTFRNRGELIDPPQPLVNVPMISPDGSDVDLTNLFGRWTYVFFVEAGCDESCKQLADAVERVRLSQGKNEKRVRLMVITLSPDALSSVDEIRLIMPKTIVLGVNAAEKEQLLPQFMSSGEASALQSGSIFLVDPMGNLMMSYPAKADPTDLRKDISRLLRASRIG